MQKMMTYSEANSVLYSSLSPNNRCLSKAVAIANDANPDLLASFANNRLVPASVVLKAAHAEVLHFFCDENGNNLGTNYTVNVPEGQGAIVFYTRILVNGQTPNTEWFEKKNWSDVENDPSWYPEPEAPPGGSNVGDFFSYNGQINSNGILRHVIYADRSTGKIESDSYQISVKWSSSARSAGIDINNSYTIYLNVNPTSHSNYNISKTVLFFRDKNLGHGESLTVNGFNNFTVTRVTKDNRNVNVGSYGIALNTSLWFSDFTIQGNKIIIHKTWNIPSNLYNKHTIIDVYKISDGTKTLYLEVSCGYYTSSWVQPGQAGDTIYEFDRRTVNKTEISPDPTSNSSFFMLSSAGSGYCTINTSAAASYISIEDNNGYHCSNRGRIVIIIPTTQLVGWRSDWFNTEEQDWSHFNEAQHNILKNSDVVSHINTALSQGAYVYLEAETQDNKIPARITIYNVEPQS